jgi:GT2 family glycosyltransferase
MSDVAEVTVVLPTIGRPALVRQCLESLAACSPRAAEILVVDSSEGGAVASIVAEFSSSGARLVRCELLGLGGAFNLGLREAQYEIVLLTNDDCVVEPDWVGAGTTALRAYDGIVTGRVRPAGDPLVVPSTIDETEPREYRGLAGFFLFTQCIAARRREILGIGGFDTRIRPSAEDNDLSYRWLRAGRTIRYEPAFCVWHHDWRSRPELERLYVDYGVGQGMVYAKHLRGGDLRIARYVLRDLYACARGLVARALFGPPTLADWRLGLVRGLPTGFVRGWRACAAKEQ